MNSPEAFYLHLQGEQRGPYTIPQIDHLLNSGLIGEETLYWREGLDQWQPVTSLVRLRRKANPWTKPLIVFGILVLLAAVLQFFGSVVLIGWRETNQHEYNERAAYWRARSIVRGGALPEGALVEFERFAEGAVELRPPTQAAVALRGEITLRNGETHRSAWSVPLVFDPLAREWSGGPASPVTP
jgi:hypothetical protein